jgi:glycosyltransferase involved in cell wall biosynthesis
MVRKPRISIGLPVFNGEKYLAEALDSILAQSYRDFEVIISDNASTDNTPVICRNYAAKDPRIHYHRNERNIGGPANFNYVFQLSSSEYFKWAAHDDIHHPDFLLKCVQILDSDSTIAMCHSKTGRINEHGEVIGEYDFNVKPNWTKTHNRFGDLILFNNEAWVSIFGLIRSSSLKKTQLLGKYISADRTLLAEIGLTGKIYSIPELLFYRREYAQTYTNKKHKTYQEKLAWWKPTNAPPKLVFPYWRVCLEYFRSVKRMPLNWTEQTLCYLKIVEWLLREGCILMSLDLGMNLLARFRWHKKLLPLYRLFYRLGGLK